MAFNELAVSRCRFGLKCDEMIPYAERNLCACPADLNLASLALATLAG
jgi:hypothetical protein